MQNIIPDCIMNPYLQHLIKIEFAVTYACTGRCRHCSEGDHVSHGECMNADIAADAVRKITAKYPIRTVMTFGGEPLLFPDTVYKIHTSARERNVPKRQVITNGYFARDVSGICTAADALTACGVNDILLSVDAFHQETIPLDTVKRFAAEIQKRSIPLRLQPAWLVSEKDDNPYNRKTKEILESFCGMGIDVNEGNTVFPKGSARRYLAEYFTAELPENPYVEDPRDVRCVSFDPSGNVLNGNAYQRDILDILREYQP